MKNLYRKCPEQIHSREQSKMRQIHVIIVYYFVLNINQHDNQQMTQKNEHQILTNSVS